eukprot:CAMPEP_0172368578 /NCGR_PEP_ID=MMETSP1060-20121228/28027_1 /TAXON_ID=37318 /ORGANISM="Pseudo-nitzschia pungens, Strain cf. cingulata" /LENGTH=653 /DNA_ID=CAMNT_0013093219 /DNA_START=136 /DNA_END=2097 /DNA_ORIENTATION=-
MSSSTEGDLPGWGQYNETSKTTISNVRSSKTIDTELKRILNVAGIESAPLDPSSAEYLREMIGVELDKIDKTAVTASFVSASVSDIGKKEECDGSSVDRAASDRTKVASKNDGALRNEPEKDEATVSSGPSRRTPLVDSESSRNATKKNTTLSTTTHLDAAKKLTVAISNSSEGKHGSVIVKNDQGFVSETDASAASLIATLRKELKDQKQVTGHQSQILLMMNDHIRELTGAVHALKDSLEDLKEEQRHSGAPVAAPSDSSTPQGGITDHPPTPAEPAHVDRPDPNNQQQNGAAARNVELRRAHELAHHVAWRIASFPIRALIFYLKYEYRIWLVMWRLAKRDVLNPFREAGMVFQLGFALLIIYGRIAPALEQAWEKQQEQYDEKDDDDSLEDGDDLMDDPQFQVQAITMAVLVAFFYHVGIIGLFYRFFIRDRLHVRIWKDLRAGVEISPTYGLNLDQNTNLEGEQDGMDNVNDRRHDNVNNNGDLLPPNRPQPVRGNHQGNVGGGGFGIIHGVNDFFMGHQRRPEQRAAVGGGAAARVNANNGLAEENPFEDDAADPNPGNPVVNFVSDIICLFYSFFVSILPTWNYEQQLRDIQDAQDRLVRARVRREAEVLRNQNNSSDGEGDESDSESGTESDSQESDSESEDDTD